ncbi:U1 [Hyposoter didymator ichnovirus]|nr:U1 [Hyposoter didymator ichnovirus]
MIKCLEYFGCYGHRIREVSKLVQRFPPRPLLMHYFRHPSKTLMDNISFIMFMILRVMQHHNIDISQTLRHVAASRCSYSLNHTIRGMPNVTLSADVWHDDGSLQRMFTSCSVS